MTQPICIIPARGGSKRFPRKNVALLNGKPLLVHAIEAAKDSKIFTETIVSSEDDEILRIAQDHGARAQRRPTDLATDRAGVVDVCRHILEEERANGREVEAFGVLLTTNPLRTAEHVRVAWERFRTTDANAVATFVPFESPPQNAFWAPDGYIQPYYDPEEMEQSQLLDTLYTHDGGVVISDVEAFLREGNLLGPKCVPLFVDRSESVDIDEPINLAWAEFLMERRDG